MPTLFEALTLGLEHQRSGRFPQAEAIYRAVLRQDPRNADALHLLGLLAYQAGRHGVAADYIRQAIRVNGRISPFHNNLGNALQGLGRLDEAISAFEQALQLDPRNVEARVNLGNVLQDQRRFDQAARQYREALRRAPERAEIHNNLGNALLGAGRLEQAVEAFDEALRLMPDYVEAYINRATALKESGRLIEAEACCREGLRRRPDLPAAHSNLAAILLQQGRLEEAEAGCREALRLNPGFCESYCNLAAILLRRKRFSEAEECARQALRLDPRHPAAYNNLGSALDEQDRSEEAARCYREALRLQPGLVDAHNNLGNYYAARLCFDEALRCYDQALTVRPADVNAHLNRGLVLLVRGDLAAGWEEYEWRWKKQEYYPRRFRKPLWDGSDPGGKTILLHAEQGLGDTLQFVRYAPLLRQRGARVVLECQPRLVPLLEHFRAGYDQLIAAGAALPEFDWHAPLPSLPRLFRTRVDTIPARVPYLDVPEEKVAVWAERMAPYTGFRVGLVWAGNPQNSTDRKRSIAAVQLLPLARVAGITLFRLQRGDSAAPAELNLVELEDEACGLIDTAAIIRNLDLLISVDTMPAHLAGGLGAPVWTLLPFAPDFRWMLAREDSPWYPTMRLFRQPRPGDWDAVVERVSSEIKNLASRSGAADMRGNGIAMIGRAPAGSRGIHNRM